MNGGDPTPHILEVGVLARGCAAPLFVARNRCVCACVARGRLTGVVFLHVSRCTNKRRSF